jgi:hypothetical protein
MVQKIGCGRKVQVGWNDKLDCPINIQCGISREGNEIIYCQYCKNIKEGKGNSMSAKIK